MIYSSNSICLKVKLLMKLLFKRLEFEIQNIMKRENMFLGNIEEKHQGFHLRVKQQQGRKCI
jgi:hypothetical protein